MTDRAIISAVRGVAPRHLPGIGCGDGWLARALHGFSVDELVVGVVPAPIAETKRLDSGEFEGCSGVAAPV